MTLQSAQEQKSSPLALHDESIARAVREALDILRSQTPADFRSVFMNEDGGTSEGWNDSDANLRILTDAGLLQRQSDGRWQCPYLLTTWEGHYYLSDWPRGTDSEF